MYLIAIIILYIQLYIIYYTVHVYVCECKSFVELQVKTNCRCDQTDRNSSNP